jgi:hypothetical protein
MAPASRTCLRIRSSGNAVTNIIGVRLPRAINRLCNSTPQTLQLDPAQTGHLYIGDDAGRVAHAVRLQIVLDRGKRCRAITERLTSPSVASRTEASSSMMEIMGACGKSVFPWSVDVVILRPSATV